MHDAHADFAALAGIVGSPPRTRTSNNGSKGRCVADYTNGESDAILEAWRTHLATRTKEPGLEAVHTMTL